MAASSRRSSVTKATDTLRYYYEPAKSKSKTSVSVSSVPKSKHDAPAVEKRPKLQRSASTSQTKPSDDKSIDKDRDKDKDKDKKHHRRTSSFLGSIFRPSIPAPATVSSPSPRVRTTECLTCGSDDVPVTRSAKLPCGHRMCNSCLRRIFTMSIKDPQHMPPKCCSPDHIPLKHVDHLFDDKFKLLWNAKYQEYTTKNRLYCPAKGCGQWIKPANMHKLHGRKYGRCPRCKTKVCTLCNNKLHTTGECPKDPETKRLVDLAKEKGWQRCYNCRAMVELNEGCNHMTCRCGSDFCMLCASPWKTCDCPWFNYAAVPDHDRLNHMRVPETVANPPRHDRTERNESHDRNDRHEPRRNHSRNIRTPMTYQQELDARRRQERTDEALARRLSTTNISDRPTPDRPRPRRRDTVTEEVFGNRGDHFLNDNYISTASHINASVIGNAAFARRGERESGRRSRRQSTSFFDNDPGLALNAFGTESLLGLIPPPEPVQLPIRRPSLRQRLGSISSQNGRERIGGWLNKLG